MYTYEIVQLQEYRDIKICQNNRWDSKVNTVDEILDTSNGRTIRCINITGIDNEDYNDKEILVEYDYPNNGDYSDVEVDITKDYTNIISCYIRQALSEKFTASEQYKSYGIIETKQQLVAGDIITFENGNKFVIGRFDYRIGKSTPVAAVLKGTCIIDRVDETSILRSRIETLLGYCEKLDISQCNIYNKGE